MSPVISANVTDELFDRIEEAQEEGESRSATISRLIRTGLEGGDSPSMTLPFALILLGTYVLAGSSAVTVSFSVGPFDTVRVGLAFLVVGLLLSRARVRRWLATQRRRLPIDTTTPD